MNGFAGRSDEGAYTVMRTSIANAKQRLHVYASGGTQTHLAVAPIE
jgi:hypothetical protein